MCRGDIWGNHQGQRWGMACLGCFGFHNFKIVEVHVGVDMQESQFLLLVEKLSYVTIKREIFWQSLHGSVQ
jgi:hypothetical protein